MSAPVTAAGGFIGLRLPKSGPCEIINSEIKLDKKHKSQKTELQQDNKSTNSRLSFHFTVTSSHITLVFSFYCQIYRFLAETFISCASFDLSMLVLYAVYIDFKPLS